MKHQHMTLTLVKSALTVALIFVFFTIFRGFSNLLNAFLVPMAIYMGLKKADKTQAFTLLGGNWLYYGLFLLAEGLVAGFGLAAMAKAVERRMGRMSQ